MPSIFKGNKDSRKMNNKKHMLKPILASLFFASNCFCQSLDSLQKKFANKVCNCIGEVKSYEQLGAQIDTCYDKTMNFIFNDATPDEIKFYTGSGNLKLITQKLEYHLKSTCPNVVQVINEYVKPKAKGKNYPTNFDGEKLKAAKRKLNSWNGKTIAFNGEVIGASKIYAEKTFLKVRLDSGDSLWVGDMTNSVLSIIGNKIRVIGYFVLTERDGDEQNEMGYMVISFASLELISNDLKMYPGSEKQVYEWANGKVPASKE